MVPGALTTVSGLVVGAVLVPGLPHLLAARPAKGWQTLAQAMRDLGRDIRATGAESALVVSTQWLSVLGLQVQTRPKLIGKRVDENWHPYDFGTIDYSLQTDVPLAEAWIELLRREQFQTRATNHEHFPVDTGVITAMRLLDPDGTLRVAQVSLNLYGSFDAVGALGVTAVKAAETLHRKVVVIAVSMMSSDPLRTWIKPEEDRLSSSGHDEWNKRMLSLLEGGKPAEAAALQSQFAKEAKADSQFRALSFLIGSGCISGNAQVRAYAPIWGMGGAVISWLT